MERFAEIASENGILLAILGVLGIAVGVVSLTIRFDFNKWQERRDEARQQKWQALCTHTSLNYDSASDKMSAESYFYSPMMSPYWICNRCGTQTLDSRVPEEILKYWSRDPEGWIEREKRFDKQSRKMGLI